MKNVVSLLKITITLFLRTKLSQSFDLIFPKGKYYISHKGTELSRKITYFPVKIIDQERVMNNNN